MNLKQVTNQNLIVVDCDFRTKKEIITFLTDKLYAENKIASKEAFLQAVMEREALSETGISDGIAIPHGKSDTVKEACFAVAKLKQSAEDWESLVPGNEVTLVFLLAIPTEQAGSVHLELLAELMTKAQDTEFLNMLKQADTADALYQCLDASEEPEKTETAQKQYQKTIVAVTACPAGIAHTYMAAEALAKAGEEMGIKVYVEKQGANGVEGRHTEEHLKEADAAIFAVEVAVKESERFQHLPIYRTKVSAPIKDAKSVILAALEKAEREEKSEYQAVAEKEESSGILKDVKESVLTGISYIIPIIVAGGMINAFAVLLAQGFGLQEVMATESTWLWSFKQMGGGLLGTIMIPVLAAYMAYSLGDKTALAPGFAAGIAANLIGGGFLCGMLGGLVAGYAVRILRKVIPARGTLAGFISFWVYPVVSTIIVGIAVFLLVGKPVAWLNTWLIAFLGSMSGSNGALLGAILGIMVSFDLGGPVNKAAYTFCVGAMAEGIFMPYAAFASVKMVSGFAITAATKCFRPLFTKEEEEIGNSTWLLVLAGITEGAIPFMMADPIRVAVSLCAGSAVTGAIIGSFGIGLDVPGAGIFSLFLLKGGPGGLMNAAIWFLAAVIGAIVSMLLLVAFRKQKMSRQKH